MRMLNKPAETTVVKPTPQQPVKNTHWYQVAILRMNKDMPELNGAFYTIVIDKPHHKAGIEANVNFVRWEPAVTVEV